jgi:exopolysaccharide production protein ExoZ
MFQGLQMLRGVAALLVLVYHASDTLAMGKNFGHAGEQLKAVFSFGGAAGVAFFFVLSGFIIMNRHKKDIGCPAEVGGYAWKRFVRVYPPYLVVFCGLVLLKTIMPNLGDPIHFDLWVLLKAILLLPQGLNVAGGLDAPVVHVAWTLQYEVFFYFLFAIAIIHWAFLPLFVTVYALHFMGYFPWLGELPLAASHFVALFLVGVLAALVVDQFKFSRAGLCFLLSSTLFFAFGSLVAVGALNLNKEAIDLVFGALSAFVIVFAVHSEGVIGFSIVPGVFGDSSYALYLVHLPLVSIMSSFASKLMPHDLLGVSVAFSVIVGCCLIAGIVFHVFLEKPMISILARK